MNNKIFVVTVSDSDGYVQHRALVNIHYSGSADLTMREEAINRVKSFMPDLIDVHEDLDHRWQFSAIEFNWEPDNIFVCF